ncbi:MAG: hypothetical protein HKL80_03705 [Acidimicrobiales bacterium]|nr:hypothetical protein [Acidimicrobiales bacterium]
MKLLIVATGGAVVFLIGYQFAVYQSVHGGFTLPHFNCINQQQVGTASGCSSENNTNYCNCNNCYANGCCTSGGICEGKPVIYLYPTRTEKVNVKLSYVSGFSKTIPSYNPISGWTVIAHPNGTLTNVTNHKTYPYLFWEGNPAKLNFKMSTGFVVKGSDVKSFLDSKLIQIGLTHHETYAFIAYWLPKMKVSSYDLIHFNGTEYTSIAPLTITPKPDALLRVNMSFKPLNKFTTIPPQIFSHFHRKGFTVVEWGGAEF